jgi:hypothetical protein
MQNPIIIIFILIVIWQLKLPAQSVDIYYEEVIGNNENSNSFSEEVIDYIEFLRKNPIPLIGSSARELSKIPTISKTEARQIVQYIKKHETISIHSISEWIGLSTTQEILLTECTTLNTYGSNYRKSFFEYRARNMHYISPVYGLEKNKFKGNALNLYQRAKFHNNNFSGCILLDKDTGEEKINDFTSGNIAYKTEQLQIIVGDYALEIGMGNILWKSFGSGKGINVINPTIETGDGIRPYTSSMDYQFFRGTAANYIFKITNDMNLKTSAWLSNINRNAKIDKENRMATSIYKSGYYRTESEIKKKETLNERSAGGEIQLSSFNYKVGLATMYFDYEYPIQSSSSSAFSGKSGYLSTAYGEYDFEKLIVFSEVSRDNKGNFAEKFAYQYYAPKFKIAGHFRNYPDKYRAQNGYNFGEFSYAANEIGLYTGLFFKPKTWIEESFYLDLFKSHNETYYVPEVVKGIEIFSETLFKLPNNNKLFLRLKTERKTDSYNNKTDVFYRSKSNIRIEWRKDFSKKLYTRIRGEGCFVNYENFRPSENGILFFIESGIRINNHIKFTGRLKIFDTDSYESAIWTFEYSFPGMMYAPAMYGEGLRFYFGTEFNITEKINLYTRYSLNYKPKEDDLGSGYLRITDNQDHRFYLQFDFEL